MDNVQEIQADHNEALTSKASSSTSSSRAPACRSSIVQELLDEGLPVLQPS
jgi:hypothetical protein